MTAIHGTTELISGRREDLFSAEVRLAVVSMVLHCGVLHVVVTGGSPAVFLGLQDVWSDVRHLHRLGTTRG